MVFSKMLLLLFMSTAAAAATAVVVVAVDVGAAAAGYLGVVGDTSWKQAQLGSCWLPSFWKITGGDDDER